MPTHSLSVAYTDLQKEVAFFLGYPSGPPWSDDRQRAIDRCVKGGLRNFYAGGVMQNGQVRVHDWSFLKPVVTLTLAAGESSLEFPADYGGVEGQLVISDGQNAAWAPLDVGPIGRVLQKRAETPDATGKPILAAIEAVKGTTATEGSHSRLEFWPEADAEYTVQFQYYLNPQYLDGTKPYAYGGPQHAETLLEGCLAVAEKILDDEATIHAAEFEKRLAVSIELDRRNRPQTLGYNGDRSDWIHGAVRRRHDAQGLVSYDGVTY